MKKEPLLFILIFILFSCDRTSVKPNQEIKAVSYIVAGNVPEGAYYSDSDVNIEIIRNDTSAWVYGKSEYIYLKNNFESDLYFNVISIGSIDNYSTRCGVLVSKNIEVSLIEDDTTYLNLLSVGDTISSNMNWKGKDKDNINIAELDFIFAEYSKAVSNDSVQTESLGKWNNIIDGYLGVREITPLDTIYGWIRLDITENYHLIAKDYAIQSN